MNYCGLVIWFTIKWDKAFSKNRFQKPIPILIDTILSVLYNKLSYIFLKAEMGISNL